MGLLNRQAATRSQNSDLGDLLSSLVPPYRLQDLLLAILNQLSAWIPGEGYYAYTASGDETMLTLKVTRVATGIATVGPNYAGLVLGSGIRTAPLELAPLSDPWEFVLQSDGALDIGCGARVIFRVMVTPKWRLKDEERSRIQGWLKQVLPLIELVGLAESRGELGGGGIQHQVRRSQQNLLLQVPYLMGLLSTLGTSVVKSTDAYLAVWRDSVQPETLWEMGAGRTLAQRLSPYELYEAARTFRFAVWEGDRVPQPLGDLGYQLLGAVPLDGQDGSAGVMAFAASEELSAKAGVADSLMLLAESLERALQGRVLADTMADNYLRALLTATQLLDEADPYNKNHHQQVAQLCARLAIEAGWPPERVQGVELAGQLHDLGMVAVALELTQLKGNLPEQSRQIIRQHPTVGSELLSGLPETVLPSIVTRAVREHHERWDGQGYPDGLSGTDLSEEGRVLACAEQFIARISHRSYRPGFPVERALYEVTQLANNQLDPEVVNLLVAVYNRAGVQPVGPT